MGSINMVTTTTNMIVLVIIGVAAAQQLGHQAGHQDEDDALLDGRAENHIQERSADAGYGGYGYGHGFGLGGHGYSHSYGYGHGYGLGHGHGYGGYGGHFYGKRSSQEIPQNHVSKREAEAK